MTNCKATPLVLSQKLCTDISIIYTWLRGEYVPKLESVVALADFFNCSVDFLAGMTDNERSGDTYKKCPPFGEHLRCIMKEKKVTEYKIRKDTRISANSFYMWLTNKCTPSIESLITLSRYFDCTIDYLIGRES